MQFLKASRRLLLRLSMAIALQAVQGPTPIDYMCPSISLKHP